MITHNGFIRRNIDNYAYDSICVRCFLTVAAVQGGANLGEMEKRHKCDPMTMVDSPKIAERVVSVTGRFEDYLFDDSWFEDYQSATNTTDADQETIRLRLKEYGRKPGLAIIQRMPSCALG
jgi:hypothetical protein